MRAARRRSAALALAVVLHALVVLLVWKMRSNAALPETTENPLMMAIRIPEETVREVRQLPPVRPSVPRPRAPPAPAPQTEEPRTGSITLPPGEAPPRVDWYHEAEITVQSMADKPSLKSQPEVMKLPPRENSRPKKGDAWVLPNGNIVVQTADNISCESGPQFVGDVFEIWARTAPVRCTYKGKPKKELKLKDHDYGTEEEIPLP